MLMKINDLCNKIPSRAINRVTGGAKHSSLCARLYLYNRYISKDNVFVNILIAVIDGIEEGHCESSARHWRIAHRKYNCYFPARYEGWLKEVG